MVGEVIAGRYELEELVGSGGTASVFRARDRILERTVALKTLNQSQLTDEEAIERFRHEARTAAQLSHPNIVTVLDRGEADGRQFIVFEYVEGESVKRLVQRTGPLAVADALELAIDVGRALAFAHQHGLVHRDVKPQNVLVDGEGTVKVTDFGIARSLDVDGVTRTGTVVGTSEYIAPEQASGKPVDAYTDVYSLGVVLFELLTGEVPFTGESFLVVAMRHVNDPVPDVRSLRPDVPDRVAAAVARAMAKEPADRFRSMGELVVELEHCLQELEPGRDDEATLAVPAVREAPKRRGDRRVARALLAGGGLALAAAVAAAAVLLADSDPSSPAPDAEPPPQAAPAAVRLRGIASYDPEGDGREHPEAVGRAADGDPATYWTTERYEDFASTKEGVGLVLDAGRPVALRALTVKTPTPGFRARVDTGSDANGPFRTASGEREVSASTTFRLRGGEARYFVVWITDLPAGVAQVSEVTAR